MGRTIQVSGFALTDSAEYVKDFLERIAGAGTIYALKLRHPKKITATSKAFAIVQFQTQESASLVENVAQRNVLRSGRFYLKVRPADRDIVPRPRIAMFSLDDAVLHLGCLVKENILSGLFSARNVSVQFGFDMKKIYFYISYNLIKYKLELSYESIWEMQLHRPPAYRSRTKFLLFQVQAAPKIYELLPRRSGLMYEDPFFNWFRDDTDEQWTRTIDFTPSASIGQSSILCLEVPQQVQVTPAKVYFYGPEINVSNRVVRHFSADLDNFLRISFVDEDCEKLRSVDLSPRSASGNDARRTALYNRVLSVLSNGISIGDKHFEFLAFSSSQLRDNSAWMFASRPGLTASDIRKWMGDFCNIRNVAKYAARLGQSFSSSTETLKVHKYEVEEIPDITNGTKYIFSDGVGKISANFALEVAMKCKLKRFAPSVFQIRYGGYKGVVAVDPRSNRKLSLRKSMSKFQSENITLDVLAYSKYQPCFLNRQLITLLSTLGVSGNVFELKQEEAVRQLNRMVTEPQAASEAIELMPMGEVTNVVKELLSCGYQPDHEPYLSTLLQTFRASKLLELKTKSRIFIKHGRAMMGCLDETRTLNYGQVFIQASNRADDHDKFVVTGKVVVAKNPCLHPGDVRVLHAVDVPDLHHMFDCVVFPQQGPRPHPNECSGSDLDGDIYFVSWDQSLIPRRMVDPMDYTPAPAETLDHDVTIEEIEEYFTNYIVNESLGIIANAHVVFADKEPLKAESEPCKELAKLFSVAVDFPKTGVPALIPPELHVKEYPDFMEKLDKVTYESSGVIGRLYREIKKHTPHIKHFTRDVARRSYDTDLIVDGYEDYISEAIEFKEEYDFKLGNLMDHYGIKSEAEIISGCILKMAKNFTKSSDADAIRLAVRSLRKEARSWFSEMSTGEDGISQDAIEAKASAWYHVTYHPQYWGSYNEGYDRPHLISFPWKPGQARKT
ncbi:hypothetical protein PVAP13_1NG415300 [Panicum virgatum]|uniref:RNA-dependent RNA polymerase n=1 Tax=Panicum virgatum TaxID=38727 RepID=A0A8T0X8Y9_PANVG|nr:hypothetical protein PVAP13_1NG415300 [Panicum virgatum]